nr:UGT154 [Lysionotus pauciflorus]
MVIHSHIGVLAFPFGTHATPLLNLVQKLANSTPGIQFSFFNSSSSNETIFSTYVSETFDNIRPHQVWDGKPDGQAFSGTHFEEVQLFLNASPMIYEKAIEEAETETGLKICCLLTDAFLWFGCDLAEKRGVPWIAFWTSASCSLSAHLHTDLIQHAMEHKGATMEQKLSFIPGMSVANLSDVPPEIFHTQNPTSLAITIYKMVEKLPKSTAVVLNSFEEIDPIIAKDLKSKLPNFLNVGPLILSSPTPPRTDKENECLSWLQHQKCPKSVVYISFGSVAVPPGNELTALAEALETCKFPFLWSLRHDAMKLLPEGFQERTREFGKMVSWAPQLQVLAHSSVGVFVTHCGWNSILESVCNGVPMICRPFFGDQKLNGRMIEDSWKIGVRVKGGVFTKSETSEALECIMSSEAIRENVNKLKDIAKDAVGSGGSSSKNFSTLLEIISGAKGNVT